MRGYNSVWQHKNRWRRFQIKAKRNKAEAKHCIASGPCPRKGGFRFTMYTEFTNRNNKVHVNSTFCYNIPPNKINFSNSTPQFLWQGYSKILTLNLLPYNTLFIYHLVYISGDTCMLTDISKWFKVLWRPSIHNKNIAIRWARQKNLTHFVEAKTNYKNYGPKMISTFFIKDYFKISQTKMFKLNLN